MIMINLKEKCLTLNQLKEIVTLAEHQETSDRYVNTGLSIKGEYYDIDVDIDADGDLTIM